MKRTLILLLLTIPLSLPVSLHALSYPPAVQEPALLKADEVLTAGAKVHLFHSGTHDVRNAIKVGDVLTVYYEYPPDLSMPSKHSAKVKVLSTNGEYYFEGYVIEGVVRPGSLAMKGTVACIITTRLIEK